MKYKEYLMTRNRGIITSILFLINLVFIGNIHAINTTTDGYQLAPSQTQILTLADSSCIRIINGPTARFIPTRTMAEWSTFSSVASSLWVSVGGCPINGVCNNSVQFACSAGSSTSNIAGSCGTNSTWSCVWSNGGSTASCSLGTASCCVRTDYDAYRVESNCFTVYPNGINWPGCMTSRYCDNDFTYPYYNSCTGWWADHQYSYGQFVWCY